jgi:predicted HicB family RNase H-like nuclease
MTIKRNEMDPKTCLKDAVAFACNQEAKNEFSESLQNYREWREKGGLEPKVEVSGDVLATLLSEIKAHRV